MTVDKRTQIIEAAIQVFAREGLERGKIADIAKEAGIGKGTVYEYFRSKGEIFSAIEQTVIGEILEQFEKLQEEELSAETRLQALVERGIDATIQMGDAVLIITELWAQGARGRWHGRENSSLASMYDEFGDQIKSILEKGMSAGEFRELNPDGVATLIMAFMDGLIWQFTIMKDEKRFSQVKREAIQSLMKGIQK
ncbi:MAG: TetR/AcrR family transcriptional regulator [Fidelibacterota bacterium]